MVVKVVLDDCREALEFCRGKVGVYHRVHYQLALAYYGNNNYEGADSHIRQLFVQGKKLFCLSMTRIDPDVRFTITNSPMYHTSFCDSIRTCFLLFSRRQILLGQVN